MWAGCCCGGIQAEPAHIFPFWTHQLFRRADCPGGLPPGHCDKPDAAAGQSLCCDPANDAECDTANTDCDSGFSKWVGLGECAIPQGYSVSSAMQAWWQLLHSKACAPEEPYECEDLSLGEDEAREAAMRSLVYAHRLRAASYKEVFDAMQTYYACTYGEDIYAEVAEVLAVLCAHEIEDCDAPVPIDCSTCGNGVLEQGEVCDGLEGVPSCEDLGLVSGEVSCTGSCDLDVSECLTCGNGVIDEEEECDGEAIDATCEGLGFLGGELTCTAACELDTSACQGGETGDSGADTGQAENDDGGGGGCDCRSTGGTQGSLFMLMLLATLGLRGRHEI